MLVDAFDLDYKLIGTAFDRVEEHREEWKKLERLFHTEIDEVRDRKAKKKRRANKAVPIGHDVIKIIRSIFTTSFLSSKFPIVISKVGEEDDERARQLSVACKHHWQKSEPYLEISKAFLSMLVFPVGIVSQYWCPIKEKVVINQENPMDIAFDPSATSPSDVQFVCYRYRKTAREIYGKLKADMKKKKRKRFYNKVEKIEEFFVHYDPNTFEPFKRYELEEIYIRVPNGWLCKTYSREHNILMREVKFRELPFQWGFALEQMSSVDENRREKQVMSYGSSVIAKIEFHINEINQRRSQHSDVIEKQINPDVFVGAGAEVNVKYLDRGAGTKIPVADANQIRERQAPTTVGLHDDMAMLKKDIETTVGVNSILQGDTNSSDRRGLGALAMLNSQSSTRVEEMITMANHTLFSHLVKAFVKHVYHNVDSDLLLKLGIEEPVIGRDVEREQKFDLMVKVDFGSEAKNLERYGDLTGIIQLLGQFPNASQEEVMKLVQEAVRIKLGDESETFKRLFAKKPNPLESGGI